jgi:hypothetical protein
MTRPNTFFPSRFHLCTGLLLALFTLATAGLGYAQTCTPGTGVTVTFHPGDNVQSVVNSTVCGSTFIFAPGVYQGVTIFPIDETTNPIDGDVFKGQNSRTSTKAAILYGGVIVKKFTHQGTYYVGTVTTTPAPASGPNYQCDANHPGCLLPEDLFFDGKVYLRVTSQAAVVAGSWYLDYSTGNFYLTDSPIGHKIEISVTHFAIYGSNVANVTISNLVVDKYAAPGGLGAISGVDPTGASAIPTFNWSIMNVEASNNHGAGVLLGNHMAVTQCFLHNNGEYGSGGSGNNITFNNNEISFNNQSGFLPEVAAGAKFSSVVGLTAEKNNVHDNLAAGLADDIGSLNITYAFNTLKNNLIAGILHEIGGTAYIHDNTSTNDGVNPFGTGYWEGAGISIANSENTQVYNNTVTNSYNGIIEQAKLRTDCTGKCPLRNVSVYNNTIVQDQTVMPGTAAAGILMQNTYPLKTAVYTSAGNTFGYNPTTKTAAPNTYTLNPSTGIFFIWLQGTAPNSVLTLSQWEADGNN